MGRECLLCGSEEAVSPMIGSHPSLMCKDCHEVIQNWIPYHTKNIKFKMQIHGVDIPDIPDEPKDDMEQLLSSMRWDLARSKLHYEQAKYKLDLLKEKIEEVE